MNKVTPAKVIGAVAILAAGYGVATAFHEHEKHIDHEIANANRTLLTITGLAALKAAECKVTDCKAK